MNRFSLSFQLLRNMGFRYITFRFQYELKRKMGLLKKRYPQTPLSSFQLSLSQWREMDIPYLFSSRDDLVIKKEINLNLKSEKERIVNGEIQFFGSTYINLGIDYDWVTNPITGYKYDMSKHWSEVEDLVEDAGDIKYVWEKSRFSFLYKIIRYDYHFNDDSSLFVFHEIEDWIDKNPLNYGPNYKCSQEISLRLLNWIFALYFYKNSNNLTEPLFRKILISISSQIDHVYKNINFSRIAVRNNHALTETLALYIVGLLFPTLPHSKRLKESGKRWFEQEIIYQIADDGSYLQYSMNYHRVVIQLLTLAFSIAHKNNERFSESVYHKAYLSLNFLYQCQDEFTGSLPNYGANDGALFFALSDNDYSDYRPQLNALHHLLTGKLLYSSKVCGEDYLWFNNSFNRCFMPLKRVLGTESFPVGGYYIIREKDTLTFIRCGSHHFRPSQSDNMHIDIWYKGENILLDAGSYSYNCDKELMKYFSGGQSHNTVMLDNNDQMLKGSRFIWYYWTQSLYATLKEDRNYYEFEGCVKCFSYIDKRIRYKRIIRKSKQLPEWEVFDEIENKPFNCCVRELWHTSSLNLSFSSNGESAISNGVVSKYYGKKEECKEIEFATKKSSLTTIIKVIDK